MPSASASGRTDRITGALMTSCSLGPDDLAGLFEPDWRLAMWHAPVIGNLADPAATRGCRGLYHGKGLGR